MDIKDLITAEFSDNKDSNIFSKNITSTERRIIVEFSLSEKNIYFKDVQFDRNVVFKNLNLNGSIRFKDCTFFGELKFDNCKIKLNQEHKLYESLFFESCNFNSNDFIISSLSSFDSQVIIQECKNIGDFHIQNSTFNSMFNISKSKIENSIEFIGNNFLDELRYENSIISGKVRHCENRYNSLTIMKSNFNSDLFFKDNFIKHMIALNDSEFKDTITIDYFNEFGEDSTLSIYNSTFFKEAAISYFKEIGDDFEIGGCRNIYIEGNICLTGLEIYGCEEMLQGNFIKEIFLNLSNKFEGLIKIQDLGIDNLYINGGNYKGNIIINNLTINENLFIHNFLNYSNFQFINISRSSIATNSAFQIVESYLDKFQFINCKLDNFHNYLIYNSNISQVKSSNTIWFNYHDITKKTYTSISKYFSGNKKVKTTDITVDDFVRNSRETFRQLKYAMENQGDRFTSLLFRSYEYKAAYSNIKKDKWKYFNDWMIMSIGRVNDFGQCWWKPILIWLPINFIFYVLLISNTQPKIPFMQINLIEFNKIFIQLLNPLHYMDKVFEKPYLEINNGTHWLDYLSRIISSFFLFEIISAFRKYIK